MNFIDIISTLQNLTNTKVTQADIGRALNIDRSAIFSRIKHNSEVKMSEVEKIATYFNVDIENLTGNKSSNEYNIPILGDVFASCGYGSVVNSENQTAVFPVSQQILKFLGANEKHCNIIFATGDSMLPAIMQGDALMVDTSKKEVVDGQIYVIRYDNELMCKRLQKIPPQKIKVVSDNEKYESYTIDLTEPEIDFEIIGRVLWYSRVAK